MKIVAYFLLCLIPLACSPEPSVYEPEILLKGRINPDSAYTIAEYIERVAVKYDLRIFQKDRREMRTISLGKDAFYISLRRSNSQNPVLWITNAGSPTQLMLAVNASGDSSDVEIDMLVHEIASYLESKHGVLMKASKQNSR